MANPVEVDMCQDEYDSDSRRITTDTAAWNYQTVTSVSNTFDRKEWEAIYSIRDIRKSSRLSFKEKVYNFLDRPKGWLSFTYHLIIFLLVFISYVFGVLSTEPGYSVFAENVLFYTERTVIIVFGIEYLLRLWAAGCRGKFQGLKGRVRYCTHPLSLIDLFIIVTSVVFFTVQSGQIVTTAVRGFRFIQIARMLHIDRQGGTWQLLKSVIISHKQELLTTVYVGMLGLILSSYFLYLVERDTHPDSFKTYADSLWWGMITMTTIGYGDKVPCTTIGRVLTAVCSLFTISFFALPAGILGSGFALKVQQQQRRKRFSRQIPAAATLIQCAWRCYAASPDFSSRATWKMFLKPNPSTTKNKRSLTEPLFRRIRRMENSPTDGDTFTNTDYTGQPEQSRFAIDLPRSTSLEEKAMINLQKKVSEKFPQSDSAPELYKKYTQNNCESVDQMSSNFISGESQTFTPDYEYSICSSQYTTINKNDFDVYRQWILSQRSAALTATHKNVIRAIRKIKYYVALKKFQEARRPFEVSDVIEQYTQGQINMMTRIKELQRRLDATLGKPVSYLSKRNKPLPIGTQLQELEQQVTGIEKKMNVISNKIDMLLNLLCTERNSSIPTETTDSRRSI